MKMVCWYLLLHVLCVCAYTCARGRPAHTHMCVYVVYMHTLLSLSTVPLTLSTLYAVSVSTLYFALDNLLDMSDELPVKVNIL